MRSMNQNHLVVFGREVDMLFQDFYLIAAVLIESYFTDTQYGGLVQKFWNQFQDIVRQVDVFRFLGIDAKPAVVRQSKFGCPLWFMLCQLAEVIVKSLGG